MYSVGIFGEMVIFNYHSLSQELKIYINKHRKICYLGIYTKLLISMTLGVNEFL